MLVLDDSPKQVDFKTCVLHDIAMHQSGQVKARVVQVLWRDTPYGQVPKKLLLQDSERTEFEAHLGTEAARHFACMTLAPSSWLLLSCKNKRRAWSNEHFNGKRCFPYPYNKMTYIVDVIFLKLSD